MEPGTSLAPFLVRRGDLSKAAGVVARRPQGGGLVFFMSSSVRLRARGAPPLR